MQEIACPSSRSISLISLRHETWSHALFTSEGAQKKSYSSSSDKWSQFSSISISICLICIIDYAMDYGDYHGLWMIMVLYGAYADCISWFWPHGALHPSRMPHQSTPWESSWSVASDSLPRRHGIFSLDDSVGWAFGWFKSELCMGKNTTVH